MSSFPELGARVQSVKDDVEAQIAITSSTVRPYLTKAYEALGQAALALETAAMVADKCEPKQPKK
jgi:hypothetical protein